MGVLLTTAACGVGVGGVGVSYDPYASPGSIDRDQRSCELWGGYWNRTANVCEMDP
ncbi:MAG: hypothetical protein FJ027_07980 [Candidatus Rokubacteria bacterium]|nr:hypothetical protein [Candidatus Rokubacteria bacterium]